MTDFFRFPRTPHLAWLAPSEPRDDKVMSAEQQRELLSQELLVEEKVDGANLGISVDAQGRLLAQNRGKFLPFDADDGQWKPLGRWLALRAESLRDALFPDLMLFGEWCYAVHSVHYTRLPDWFLAFDVYDRTRMEFWSAARRNVLAAQLGLAVVPAIASGRFDLKELRGLLGRSRLGDTDAEGLYLRADAEQRLQARAKLVRPEFVQAIGAHWSRRTLRTNSLRAGPEVAS